MLCGIYKITNKINGHAYIGQSINITRRWRDHKNRYLKDDNSLYKAFRKYGLENFDFIVVEECEPDKLNEREKYYIAYYNTFFDGYNETTGGENTYTSSVEPEYVNQIRWDLANTLLTGIQIGIKYDISDQAVSDINQGKVWYKEDIAYPIRKQSSLTELKSICPKCGQRKSATANLCFNCYENEKPSKKPSLDILIKEIYNSSFAAVGRKYGVTDNAVKKWCKSYGIPYKIKEFRQWYEEQNNIKKEVVISKPRVIKKVIQIDIETQKTIAIYNNLHDAGRALGNEDYRKHIGDVCNGYRKTAYGYMWKYEE